MKIEPGQVAVVTGGASGIGLALGRTLGQRGLRVVLSDLRADSVQEAARKLRGQGVDVLGVATDVADAGAVEDLARATLAHFGRVDVVCNNAGISGPIAPMWEQDLIAWRWHLDVMVMGMIHGVRSFVPHLITRGTGHVLNTASAGGLMPLPLRGPYNAAKHAVVGLTETLAEELLSVAPGVGTSVLCPGITETQLATTSIANRPRGLAARPDEPVQSTEEKSAVYGSVQTADEVALAAVQGIEEGRLHVVPNPDTYRFARARVDGLLADLV